MIQTKDVYYLTFGGASSQSIGPDVLVLRPEGGKNYSFKPRKESIRQNKARTRVPHLILKTHSMISTSTTRSKLLMAPLWASYFQLAVQACNIQGMVEPLHIKAIKKMLPLFHCLHTFYTKVNTVNHSCEDLKMECCSSRPWFAQNITDTT